MSEPRGADVGADSSVEFSNAGTTAGYTTADRPGRWDPPVAPGVSLARATIVDRLCRADGVRVVTIVAPAGYGKTTLLGQWVEQDSRRTAWLNVDRFDNDPAVLLTGIHSALLRAGMMRDGDRTRRRFDSSTAMSEGVSMVAREIDDSIPALLILDLAASLDSTDSKATLVELMQRLPANVVLVTAGRVDMGLPTAKLAARGAHVAISSDDLSLTRAEVADLAVQYGISLENDDVDELLVRTEGWPMAVHLKLVDLQSDRSSEKPFHVCGNDDYLVQCIRDEVLGRLSDSETSFLMRCSILDSLSGDLCSFVLEDTRAPEILDSLTVSHSILFPVDRHRTWYRYHHLVREFLAEELRHREPDLDATLHARAARWYELQGVPDQAISHAMAAGDEDLTSRLILASAQRFHSEGALDTVMGWLDWFEERDRSARHPEMALIATLACATTGDTAGAQRWWAVATASRGNVELEPMFLLASALTCSSGFDQMHDDAHAAEEGLTAASSWSPVATTLVALTLLWNKEVDSADALFGRAAALGERHDAAVTAVLSLAARAGIAASRGEGARAGAFVEQSLSVVRRYSLERSGPTALAFVEAARAAIHRGDPTEAGQRLDQANALRPALTAAMPLVSVHILLAMAEVEIRLARIGGARQALREATDIAFACDSGEQLQGRINEMKERIASAPMGAMGVSTLTNAELRLLPLLATHLSFPEIGERLYISRHTVKSQALSIYRKLGASSRSEAVRIAQEKYLLLSD